MQHQESTYQGTAAWPGSGPSDGLVNALLRSRRIKAMITVASTAGYKLGILVRIGPSDLGEDLAQPKIRQFDVTIFVYEDIVRLKVAVNDVVSMQKLQGANDFADVESCSLFFKRTVDGQTVEYFPSARKVHDVEKLLWILKGVVEADDEGMSELGHDVAFGAQVLHFFRLFAQVTFTNDLYFRKKMGRVMIQLLGNYS